MSEDLSAFDEAPEGSALSIAAMTKKAEELIEAERQADEVESLLKAIKGRIHELKTRVLPEAMAAVGLSEFSLPDGTKVAVGPFVSGTLPKEPSLRAVAIRKLEELGGGSIIVNELSLTFEKSQHNEALALAEDLRARGFAPELSSGVHPQTFLAFIRQVLADGKEVDAAALNLFIGSTTKVTPPKAPKPKKKKE